jgi:hypothetical protein
MKKVFKILGYLFLIYVAYCICVNTFYFFYPEKEQATATIGWAWDVTHLVCSVIFSFLFLVMASIISGLLYLARKL